MRTSFDLTSLTNGSMNLLISNDLDLFEMKIFLKTNLGSRAEVNIYFQETWKRIRCFDTSN